jgi:diguanylate cyclase (GGDEF)-like protein
LSAASFFQQKYTGISRTYRGSIVASVLLSCVVIIAVLVVDMRHTENFRTELRTTAHNLSQLLHNRLSARIDHDVSLIRSLAHSTINVSNDPVERFGSLAEHNLNSSGHFISIGLAPGYQLQNIYPAQWVSDFPKEKIRQIMEKRLEEIREGTSADTKLTAPIMSNAEDGALILVVPIMDSETDQANGHGAVVLVIDQDKFLDAANAHPDNDIAREMDGLQVALKNSNTSTAFIGADHIVNSQPAIRQLNIPGGSWDIMASPKKGWDALPEGKGTFRLMLSSAAIAMILPIFIASFLISERNRNIAVLRARESRLQEISQRFKLAMESSNIGIWELDEHGERCFWDERASGLHGLAMLEQDVSLQSWLSMIVPEDRAATEAYVFNCMLGTKTFSQIYRLKLADNSIRYIRSAGANYTRPDGTRRTTGIAWDVSADSMMAQNLRDAMSTSEIKNAELELALQELFSREQDLEQLSGRLDLALASYQCGTWESRLNQSGAIWDRRMHQLYELDYVGDGHVTRERWLQCLVPEDRETAAGRADTSTANNTQLSDIQRVRLPNGEVRYVRSVGQIYKGRSGEGKIVGIAFDITADMLLAQQLQTAKEDAEAKNAELEIAKNRIEHNSLHDPLTGLFNRRKLDLELDALPQREVKSRNRFAIIHLDLDRFKQINDTLGHAAGDAMLIHAAKILKQYVHQDDLVARIGGDEFVIVVQNNCDRDTLKELSLNIIDAFRQPLDFEGFSCRCGVSIGIAFGEGIHADARKTLINADLALYRAKSMGRNRYEFFTQNLQAEVINTKRIADEILVGIENGEFETWYQPQFCAKTRQIVGAEALIRWRHPTRGIVTPDKFLKIAEDLNVMASLDRQMLETALTDKRLWNLKGITLPRVSVNVSLRRLNNENLMESLADLNIMPGEVAFELVESIFLDESEHLVSSNIESIKALGIDIEVDDFGTGHTSIVSLLRLKPKRLKIDRQLVMPILEASQERALVRSIIDIARSLGIETVAEGVESKDHATMLAQMGCDLLQGYAFAKPLSAEDFSAQAKSGVWSMAS